MADIALARACPNGYPVELELNYRVMGGVRGSGRTVNLSSNFILFDPGSALPTGARIELLIAWPVALNGRVGLRLWVTGTIIQNRSNGAAVEIARYEFRVTTLQRQP